MVSEKTGVKTEDVKSVVRVIFHVIGRSLHDGEPVNIKTFGIFHSTLRSSVMLPLPFGYMKEVHVIRFRPHETLRKLVHETPKLL